MAITINDNIKVNAGKPTDSKYLNASNSPYTGITEVNSRISVPERHVGLTVNVNNEEYWYATGVTNGDLILKSLGEQIQVNNGLTKLSGTVSLGGTLTGNTTIDGTHNLCLGSSSNILTALNIITDCYGMCFGDVIGGYNYGTISTNNSGYQFNWIGDSQSVVLDINNNGVLLNNTQTCDGIRYAHDYSVLGGANPRWIPDAAWVTGQTSGITSYSFNNGLTEAGDVVSLGGTLTGDTTIDGSFDFSFGVSGVSSINNFIVQGTTATIASDNNTKIQSDSQIDIITSGSICTDAIYYELNPGAGGMIVSSSGGITFSGSSNYNLTTNNIFLTSNSGGVFLDSQGNNLVINANANDIVLVGNVLLSTPPQTGSTSTDSVLVWNSSDNYVKQISPDNLGEDNNNYSVTAITSSTVSLTGSEYVVLLDTTTSGVTVTLSNSPIMGDAVKIKDKSGNAFANNIIIDSGSGNTIDGSQCALINTDYGGVELVYGDTNSWYALSYIT